MRKDVVQNILHDEGISIEVQYNYTDEELYEFAEELCEKNGESLEEVIALESTRLC